MTVSRTCRFMFLLLLGSLFCPAASFALHPEEILVIANRDYDDSTDLARYYMEKRKIPGENLLRLWTTRKIFISREDYVDEIANPVRDFLKKRKSSVPIKCLVLMRGIPLRVDPPKLNDAEQQQVEKLKQQRDEAMRALKTFADQKGESAASYKYQLDILNKQIKQVSKKESRAAVDSELALIMVADYPLEGWLGNPFFIGFQNKDLLLTKDDVLLVSRLDAPTEKIVKRVIDDSILTEQTGLKGKAYFDARWKKSTKKRLEGYALYDDSIHLAADYVRTQKLMPVVLDTEQRLFQTGEAPEAALYCGWYSHHQYVDAFDWQPGAVGYHIASSECSTLRSGNSQVWCKRMLEDGADAVIGPVGEPYVQSFPLPELFFKALTDGYYTLAESYFLSLPYLSWQMVLVGDPLYRPFRYREQ